MLLESYASIFFLFFFDFLISQFLNQISLIMGRGGAPIMGLTTYLGYRHAPKQCNKKSIYMSNNDL